MILMLDVAPQNITGIQQRPLLGCSRPGSHFFGPLWTPECFAEVTGSDFWLASARHFGPVEVNGVCYGSGMTWKSCLVAPSNALRHDNNPKQRKVQSLGTTAFYPCNMKNSRGVCHLPRRIRVLYHILLQACPFSSIPERKQTNTAKVFCRNSHW